MVEWLQQIDTSLFLAINGWHNETWDGIMWWISGKRTWWPFSLLILGYLGWKNKWHLAFMILFIALIITLADQSSVHLFKNVFQRLRPCHEPSLEGLVHLVNNKCGGQFGFISSHASNSFGVAMLVLLWVRKGWATWLMLCWALLVAYSRVYLGVHYPGDVLAGAIWGAACGWLIYRIYNLLQLKLAQHWWIAKPRQKE
jgi:undecaprenyl-diphosphatase